MSINEIAENLYSVIDPYLEEDEDTMANQLALALDAIFVSIPTGETIWTDEYQPCADWLYQNIDGADIVIDSLNKQSFAGCPHFDMHTGYFNDEYRDMIMKLIKRCMPDEEEMEELNEEPAAGSVFDCEGPVLDAMERFENNRVW